MSILPFSPRAAWTSESELLIDAWEETSTGTMCNVPFALFISA